MAAMELPHQTRRKHLTGLREWLWYGHLVMDVVVATEVDVRTPFVVKVAVVALAVEDAGPVGQEPEWSVGKEPEW